MDTLTVELTKLLLPVVVAAILGGLKYLAPKIKSNVPNVFWPFAVYGLARVGTAACHAIGAACSGNPLNWDETTVTALATAFLAVVVREASKSLPDLKSLVLKVKDAVTK